MIRTTKQNWEAGSVVKVGFLKLAVLANVPSPGDYLPDQYLLRGANGQHYCFVPHNGCFKIDERDADAMRAGRALAI
jgi:hypothetical protein